MPQRARLRKKVDRILGYQRARARTRTPASTSRVLPFEDAELVETHTSRVFLTADRAYKVKKPVRFPFLDYGTLAKRERLCREEVRLNRRLAPSLYLGVRSLVPAPGGRMELAGPGAAGAAEYAVEMRRIPPGATLAERVAARTATRQDVAAVAGTLARFHRAAERVEKHGASGFKRHLDGSFADLLELDAVPVALTATEPLFAAALRRLTPELDTRTAAGWVRDGHGDLRAEHVVLGDPIEIFDCVEFDAGLRRIDVGCDLAFLAMDLERLGAPDLARALVDEYRVAGSDPGSDALLALFAGYRAIVRAKVALIRAGQLRGAARRTSVAEAESLAALARRVAWRSAFPLAVVVCGPAATGKTTVASALAEAAGVRRVGTDLIRKRLAGVEPDARAPLAAYGREASRRTYAEAGRAAAGEVRAHGGVVVDGTFRRRADRDAFAAAFGDACEPVFVECRAPADVVAARAAARASAPSESDAGRDEALGQLGEFDPLDEIDASRHAAVRTDRPAAGLVAAVERRLLAGVR